MELTARVHLEDGSYWADIAELPGVFAAGETLDELFESLKEGVSLHLEDAGPVGGSPAPQGPMHVATAVLTDRPLTPA